MKTKHVKGKSDGAGNFQLPVGVPNAQLDITVIVEEENARDVPKTFREFFDTLEPLTCLERLPESPVRDPWEEGDANGSN